MKIKQPGFRWSVFNISVLITIAFTNLIYAKIEAPSNIDFGNVEVTDSLRIKVPIINLGLTELTITDFSDPGIPFGLRGLPDLPVQITPEDSIIIYVMFKPKDSGIINAEFVITSDDEDNPSLKIELEGEGFSLNAADKGSCYASAAIGDSSTLIQIDPSTGAGTLIGTIGLNNVQSLAINSVGKIYGTDSQGNLYRIDAKTAETVFISNPGLGPLAAITFDKNDTLYALTGYGRYWWFPQNLTTIELTSGTVKTIGEINVSINGLSFDPVTGKLWGAGQNNIYTIDKSTAMSNLIGNTNLDYPLTDLNFDVAGNLFAIAGGGNTDDNFFIMIDKTTGTGSIIGKAGFSSITGLAFYNESIEGKHISIIPSIIKFGYIEVADSSFGTITISNIGTEDLTIVDVTDPESPFSIISPPDLPLVLSSGNSQYVNVSFSPSETGASNNSIIITSNNDNIPETHVLLQGTGLILNPADSGACYVFANESDSTSLFQIEPSTGIGTMIGSTGVRYLEILAINSEGKLYSTGNSGKIYRVDAASGRAILSFDPMLGSINGMTFDNRDSLYVLIGSNLFIIDPITGSSQLIGDTGLWFDRLFFNPVTGTLWALGSNTLYTIDITSAQATMIEDFNPEYGLIDLSFDVAGNLFAIIRDFNDNDNILVTINETERKVYIIGETGFYSVNSMTFYTVPLTGKHLRVIPSSIDFGFVEVGYNSPEIVRFSNVGTQILTVHHITDPGDGFGIPELPVIIQSTGSQSLQFSFTAPDTGGFSSTVIIKSDDTDYTAMELILHAEGFYVAPAEPGKFYMLTEEWQNSDIGSIKRLRKIDPMTGRDSIVGPIGLEYGLRDITINTSGIIYGIGYEGSIYRINADNGKAWFLSNFNLDNPVGLVFNKNNDLYAVDYPMYKSGVDLVKINLTKKSTNVIANYREIGFDGIAFNPVENRLWGFATSQYSNHYIFSLDDAENQVHIANIPYDKSIIDMEFDIAGNLLAIAGDNNQNDIISLDKSTGRTMVISDVGIKKEINALAVSNVPMRGSQIRVISTHNNFGFVEVGDTSYIPVSISNVGTNNLTINSISIPESPFVFSDLPAIPTVISTGESLTFSVKCIPQGTDHYRSAITVSSDDIDNPNVDISLNVQGFLFTSADSGKCFASSDYNEYLTRPSLIEINPVTGEGSLIGDTGLYYGLSGLAINSKGKLYASDYQGNLYRIDAGSGKAIFMSNPGIGVLHGIAFDKDDVLYASPYDPLLYKIDPRNGYSDRISLTGDHGAYYKGMSFDPLDGTLWASDGGTIFKINVLTREKKSVGEISTDWYDRAIGLAFDAAGNLFSAIQNLNDSESCQFAIINKNTGKATYVGYIGFPYVGGLSFHPKTVTTDINVQGNSISHTYALRQNYPNPFNPSTTIEFSLPKSEFVELKVYNILGKEVSTLVAKKLNPGNHTYTFDGKNLASGVYYYRIEAGNFVQTRKMIYLK